MRLVQRMAVVGALVSVLAACSAESEEPVRSVEEASATDGGSTDNETRSEDAAESSSFPGSAVPRVIESDLRAENLEALIGLGEEAGLDCSGESGDGEATTHTGRLCGGNVLVAYFFDVDAMDGYVTLYVDRGNHVVRGDNWFVTGKPAVIDPLIPILKGE